MKKIIILIILVVLFLVACGSKDKLKDDLQHTLLHDDAIMFNLKEYNFADGKITCTAKYGLEGFTGSIMADYSLNNTINEYFKTHSEVTSLTMIAQGTADNHVYQFEYERDGDGATLKDCITIQ